MKFIAFAVSLLALIQVATPVQAEITAEESIAKLKEGNNRYTTGRIIYPRVDLARRAAATLEPMHPIAVVLDCSDARVPPHVVLDTKYGDLFNVRVAGNVCDKSETASIEYAVQVLKAPLVLVLGHNDCSTVAAAVEGRQLTGNMATLSGKISPAMQLASQTSRGQVETLSSAIKHNVWNSIADLFKQSAVIRQSVKSGKLQVIGAIRDMKSGRIDWLGKHPLQDELLQSK